MCVSLTKAYPCKNSSHQCKSILVYLIVFDIWKLYWTHPPNTLPSNFTLDLSLTYCDFFFFYKSIITTTLNYVDVRILPVFSQYSANKIHTWLDCSDSEGKKHIMRYILSFGDYAAVWPRNRWNMMHGFHFHGNLGFLWKWKIWLPCLNDHELQNTAQSLNVSNSTSAIDTAGEILFIITLFFAFPFTPRTVSCIRHISSCLPPSSPCHAVNSDLGERGHPLWPREQRLPGTKKRSVQFQLPCC